MFWRENLTVRDNSGDQDVDGRVESDWDLGTLDGGVKWIQLAQDSERWRNLVNMVMNFLVLAPQS
jgi:hypothetical protein